MFRQFLLSLYNDFGQVRADQRLSLVARIMEDDGHLLPKWIRMAQRHQRTRGDWA
ncbi:hypothetical protein [Pandoraea horticolens]|uniref:hypothetical protein n=1 Tax=Pandoraea horticolens TaxID=2508298 RepID=UPI0015818907|nr:hypothetical protein [Pandoraea horticolens]